MWSYLEELTRHTIARLSCVPRRIWAEGMNDRRRGRESGRRATTAPALELPRLLRWPGRLKPWNGRFGAGPSCGGIAEAKPRVLS